MSSISVINLYLQKMCVSEKLDFQHIKKRRNGQNYLILIIYFIGIVDMIMNSKANSPHNQRRNIS